MGDDKYSQEFECSFDSPVEGSYYAALLGKLAPERFTEFPKDDLCKTYTAWDLGVGDSTAIWVCQVAGQERRLIDFYENHGVGLDSYVKWIRDSGYTQAEHILPHDVEVRELGSGKSRKEALQDLGLSYDERRNVFYDKPLHDWSSHAADAFRYLAVGLNTNTSWGKPLPINTKWIV